MEALNQTIRIGCKETKLGLLPQEWEVVRINDVSTKVGSGSTPRGGEKVYSTEGVPFIRSQNVNYNRLVLEDIAFIPIDIHEQMSSTTVYPGDILLNITGASIGRSCVVPEEFEVGNVNQHVCIIRLRSGMDKRFVQAFLSSYDGQKSILRTQVGGNREGLNFQSVRSILLPAPTLTEQRKIAEILSTWDEAIELTQKLIDQLKLRKKGLMQKLLTGKKRLPGFEGEWEEHSYGSLFKEVSRPVDWDDEELYHLISVRRRSGGLFQRESLHGKQILTKNLKTAKAGDFLISKMQIVHGASGMVTPEFDNMKVSGSYICLTAKDPEVIDINFMNRLSQLPWFYHQTYVSSYGVHIEKMTFNLKSFLKLKCQLPSIQEQKAICEVLDTNDAEISLQQEYLEQLQLQKKGLMQQLLTGKTRVPLTEAS